MYIFQVALNASNAWNKWNTLESSRTKVLGHRRSKPGMTPFLSNLNFCHLWYIRSLQLARSERSPEKVLLRTKETFFLKLQHDILLVDFTARLKQNRIHLIYCGCKYPWATDVTHIPCAEMGSGGPFFVTGSSPGRSYLFLLGGEGWDVSLPTWSGQSGRTGSGWLVGFPTNLTR